MIFIDMFKVLGGFCLFFTIFGTFANALVFATCLLKLRDNITFIFIAFLSVSDTFTLYGWSILHFAESFGLVAVFLDTSFKCRFVSLIQYVSFQTSAWLLVRDWNLNYDP